MKTIECTLNQIIFEAPDTDYKVLKVRQDENGVRFTAVGELPDLAEGQKLTLTGEWTQHETYGRQFQIKQAELHQPTTVEGIQNYLASSLIEGIGPTIAERITDKFGEDTLEVMDEDIEQLQEISGIGTATLETIKEDWEEQHQMRNVMLFLKEHRVSTAYARRIYEEYGDEAVSVLRRNPYQLCRDVEGIGFKIADRIARKLGTQEHDRARLEAGLEHVLVKASEDGHVYLTEEHLRKRVNEILNMDSTAIEEPLESLVQQKRIVLEQNGETRVYLKTLYDAEKRVASKLTDLQTVDTNYKTVTPSTANLEIMLKDIQEKGDFEYNTKQSRAIRASVNERILILTGGPGTGKTTTVIGMLEVMERLEWTVNMAAPTGRAAQRLEEATGHNASTIHRMLDYQPPNVYGKGEDDPLEADVVIVDELSMVDLRLVDRLLQAISKRTRLILVGDADQLPSVGPGDVLNDLIESSVLPVVRLTEIFRQARKSRIVKNAHRINNGEMPELSNQSTGDFFFLEESDPGKAREIIVSLVSERLPEHYGFDPFKEIQVVVPMYKGECGVNKLNKRLQQKLNPGRGVEAIGEQNFLENDRIMQLKNNYEKHVFNGDVGRIRSIDHDEDELTVNFPDSDPITYHEEQLGQLTLAYAITIHKSQGSEFPAVIIPVLTQHYIMLQRNLLYTALTRATELAVLVGTTKSIGMAVNNAKDRKRNTRLPERIRNQ